MDLGLNDARALVMGSSAGMGLAIATSLANEGVRVVLAGRDEARLSGIAEEIGAAGYVALDVTRSGAPAELVHQAVDVLGGLDIHVGNSGGGKPGGFADTELTDVDDAYRRMLLPQLAAMQAAIPHLRKTGSGRLVVLTARSIFEASPDLALSSVFRSGVAAAAKSLALELAPDVTVNVVVPGQFDTGALQRFEAATAAADGIDPDDLREHHLTAIPLGRLGDASELGDLVTFLVSQRASYITGATITIDGGLSRGF